MIQKFFSSSYNIFLTFLPDFFNLSKMEFSSQITVEKEKPDSLDHHVMGSYREEHNLTNDEGILSSLSLFLLCSPFTQSIVSFAYNHRSVNMDSLMTQEVKGIMSVPWMEDVPIKDAFDSSTTITFTFFALEEVESKIGEYCNDLATPYGMYFEEYFKQYGLVKDLHLAGVKVRPVNHQDVDICLRRLNLVTPKFDTLRERVIHLFSYLGSCKFRDILDIESFCNNHGLQFIVANGMKYHEAIVSFRMFLQAQLPIKLSIVDGQHRMMSVVTAFENSVLSQYSPVKHLKAFPAPPLNVKSEIFKRRKIN